ncbi:DoxX family protein [Fictibacillus barbaricus]|uniref:DoxX family protein n=1 Tax=Fictibacillus barbaricus TaxID=182136 RepID=A0ABS2Z966_9BACL|nr:DoxX family protein [Fictibacillus barbaricus]MBN3544152.1 DoxX family protein [Fictibacillus barbaricus]
MAWGLLIIRVIVGLTLIGHGTQKWFGWFGGYGLKATGGWLHSINVKPGLFMAFLIGLAEIVGGLLFVLGWGLPYGAALIVIIMLGAIITVHGKNGWMKANGFEYNLILIAIAIGLALIGPGIYTL